MSTIRAEVLPAGGRSVAAGAAGAVGSVRPRPRDWARVVDGLVALLTTVVLAPVLGVSWAVAIPSVAGWCAIRLVRRTPGVGRAAVLASGVSALFLAVSAVALVVGLLDLPTTVVRDAASCLVPATVVVLVVGLVLEGRRRPVRAIVLDDTAHDAGGPGRPDWWPAGGPGAPEIVGTGAIAPDGTVAPVAPVGSGEPAELEQAVESWQVDLVAVAPGTHLAQRGLRSLTWRLEPFGTPVALLSPAPPVAAHRIDLRAWTGQPVLQLGPPRASLLTRVLKQTLDRGLGAVLLVATLPLLALLAVAVRCESRGPAIFAQTRVGRDGRPFRMYKLRTMHTGAETLRPLLAMANEAEGPLFKMQLDPRVTRLGRLLRRTSLDELPQLVNVVRGDMSLVGPRPALPAEVAQYDARARRRLAVRPGLTGLWQVSGRSDLPWEQSVELDLHYTDNISIIGDLAICVRTVRAIVGGKGAY